MVEDIDFGDSVYFFIITATTVGYGDISPTTVEGRIINSFLIICDTIVFGYLFILIVGFLLSLNDKRIEQSVEKQKDPSVVFRRKLIINTLALIFMVAIGTIFMYYYEGYEFADSFNWTFVTMSTVG